MKKSRDIRGAARRSPGKIEAIEEKKGARTNVGRRGGGGGGGGSIEDISPEMVRGLHFKRRNTDWL